MLHFSGDVDGAVPTDGTLRWINDLNRTTVEDWRQYKVGNTTEVGGYIEEYDGLTFATVHGAGHMVPEYKPAAAYHLILNWVLNRPI
jgi:carboxypeptidase C (cathepsin A)